MRAVSLFVCMLAVTACGSEPQPVTPQAYRAALDDACAQTTAVLDALPDPPDDISIVDFATGVAAALTAEAERVRALDVPRDLAGDHRAFIRNTEEQAAEWRSIAQGATLGEHTDAFARLMLGRDDLADEMGVPQCRRGIGDRAE